MVFPSRFVSWFVVLEQKKTPFGVVRDQTGFDLKTHDSRHCGEIGVQVCIEGGIVVVDGAIRILQAIAGKHADHGRSRRDLIFPLQETCDGGCTGRFAEDAFLATQKLVGLNDFGIGDVEEGTVAGLTSGDRFGAVHRIADANGGCNRVRIAHGGVVDQRRGAAGLEAHHARQ